MPDDEPEVCLMWPAPVERVDVTDHAMPEKLFVVDTAFPVAMHVCRESRAAILLNPRLRLRRSRAAGFPVPFREYRPELDTLYCSRDHYRRHREADEHVRAVLQETQELATEEHFFHDRWSWMSLVRCPPLHTVTLVLSRRPDQEGSSEVSKPPVRRCKLRWYSAAETEAMRFDTRRLNGYFHPEERISLAAVLDGQRAALEHDLRRQRAIEVAFRKEDSLGWSLEPVTLAAAMFVEYQPDGTWKEISAGWAYPKGEHFDDEIPLRI